MRSIRSVLVIPLLALLVGCDALGITSLSDAEKAAVGTYTLETVNRAGLPALAGQLPPTGGNPDGCPIYVNSGGIKLSGDRRAEVWFTVSSVCTDPPPIIHQGGVIVIKGGGTTTNEVRQSGKWELIGGTTLKVSKTGGSQFTYENVTVVGRTITAPMTIHWEADLPIVAVFRPDS